MAEWRAANAAAHAEADGRIGRLRGEVADGLDDHDARVGKMGSYLAANPALTGEIPCGDIQAKLVEAMTARAPLEAVQGYATELKGCMREAVGKGSSFA
jgi:hypothetical protein